MNINLLSDLPPLFCKPGYGPEMISMIMNNNYIMSYDASNLWLPLQQRINAQKRQKAVFVYCAGAWHER